MTQKKQLKPIKPWVFSWKKISKTASQNDYQAVDHFTSKIEKVTNTNETQDKRPGMWNFNSQIASSNKKLFLQQF